MIILHSVSICNPKITLVDPFIACMCTHKHTPTHFSLCILPLSKWIWCFSPKYEDLHVSKEDKTHESPMLVDYLQQLTNCLFQSFQQFIYFRNTSDRELMVYSHIYFLTFTNQETSNLFFPHCIYFEKCNLEFFSWKIFSLFILDSLACAWYPIQISHPRD